jgi:hypothetical protein
MFPPVTAKMQRLRALHKIPSRFKFVKLTAPLPHFVHNKAKGITGCITRPMIPEGGK